MRSRILSSLLAGLTLMPAFSVRAQEAEAGGEGEAAEESETAGSDVVDSPSEGSRPGRGGRDSAPGEVHTVSRGDTLWDLSQRYLGSPWYWPKVWSYNPEISNPHWIYPGNLVRFFQAGEEVPSRVDVGAEPTELGEDVEAPVALEAEPRGEDLVQVSGKIGYEPKPGARVVHSGFVTARELDEAGKIESSFAESFMLSYPDTVYVRFKNRSNAKLGDRYVVFRTEAAVRHPVSGAQVGHLTKFLGVLRVVALSDKLVTAQIQETWDEVNRGDLVGPFGEQLAESVTRRPNEKEVKGFVVTAMVPYLTLYGEHHEVVVDKGSGDGVQPGNTFTIVRQQDLGGDLANPAQGQDKNLPLEEVAECLAVDVKDRFTNCLMTRSIREVVPGDRAEMRIGSPRTASR